MFCSQFDEALAQAGPPAVFLRDTEGLWRFDARWTRDCWGRAPGPHILGSTWLLARDTGSGFVTLLLSTSPTLLETHPRLQIRAFPDEASACEVLEALGSPPLADKPW